MCNRVLRLCVSNIGLTAAVSISALSGCSAGIRAEPDPLPLENGGTHDRETVLVRFVNLTVDQGVDIEFYAADEPLETLPGDLFVDEHLATAGIGFVGLGIIEPKRTEVIELPCGEHLTIGTRGGIFLDNRTGQETGGGTMRWVQEGQLGLCGATVTFSFAAADEGFTTTLTVTD